MVCRGQIDGRTQHHISVHLHSLFLCPRGRRSGSGNSGNNNSSNNSSNCSLEKMDLMGHAEATEVPPRVCVLQIVPELVNVQQADVKAILPLSELDDAGLRLLDSSAPCSLLPNRGNEQHYRIGDEIQTMLLNVEDPQARIVLSMKAQRVKGLSCILVRSTECYLICAALTREFCNSFCTILVFYVRSFNNQCFCVCFCNNQCCMYVFQQSMFVCLFLYFFNNPCMHGNIL